MALALGGVWGLRVVFGACNLQGAVFEGVRAVGISDLSLYELMRLGFRGVGFGVRGLGFKGLGCRV